MQFEEERPPNCTPCANGDTKYSDRLLVNEIVSRLSSTGEDRVKEGLSALSHWANQLNDDRILRIPNVVMAALTGQLNGEHSYTLIHTLDAIRNLIGRLTKAESKRLLQRSEAPLRHLAQQLEYKAESQWHDTGQHMRADLPDLRAAMTRLCVAALNHKLESSTVTSWLEGVRSDPMPEIRRALANSDADWSPE